MGNGCDGGDVPAVSGKPRRAKALVVAAGAGSSEFCESVSKMNRAFYIIAIPAFITSFCWLAFGWGWRFASIVTGIELVIAIAAVIYLLRRESAQKKGAEAGR